MKKTILIVLLLLGFMPVLKHGEISIVIGTASYAQSSGDDKEEVQICADFYTEEEDFQISGGTIAQISDCSVQVDCDTRQPREGTDVCQVSYFYYPDNLGDPSGGGGGTGGDGGGDGGGSGGDGGEVQPDCMGMVGGTAHLDDCGNCVAGTSGHVAYMRYADNDGDGWGGTTYFYCYTIPTGFSATTGDYNDNCYNPANDSTQCQDPCGDALTAKSLFNDTTVSSQLDDVADQGDHSMQRHSELLEFGAPISIHFNTGEVPFVGTFSYNNVLTTSGTAQTWAPSNSWTPGDYAIGWIHYHQGSPGEAESPADMHWFAAQVHRADSGFVSPSGPFFQQHAIGYVVTSTDIYAVMINDWPTLWAHDAHYMANVTQTNLDYENYKSQGGEEYALLHMYGKGVKLFKAPRTTKTFVPIQENHTGTGSTTIPCP